MTSQIPTRSTPTVESDSKRASAERAVYEFPEFIPHPLLRGGHAQTIAGAYVPHRRMRYQAVVHPLELPDGDRTALHDDCPESFREGVPCVLLIHGLGGSHLSPYMVRVSDKLRERGVRAFRLDLRGHGAGWDWARRPGHAGRSEDARVALEHIHALCPMSPVAAVGVSMGGNILLKLLGEWGPATPAWLTQAMAIAPPVDLAHCSRNILSRANWLYNRAFLRGLERQLRLRRRVLQSLDELRPPRSPENIWEFDDWVTAPLAGYRDAADYYEQSSAARVIERIRVPTTILTAADDPLIPVEMFEKLTLPSQVRVHVTSSGGHIGYLGVAGRDPDRRWLDWRILEWTRQGMVDTSPASSPPS